MTEKGPSDVYPFTSCPTCGGNGWSAHGANRGGTHAAGGLCPSCGGTGEVHKSKAERLSQKGSEVMSDNARPSSPDHDEFCQDLLYGFYAPDGRWIPPADGIANEFPWHAQYHLRTGKKGLG